MSDPKRVSPPQQSLLNVDPPVIVERPVPDLLLESEVFWDKYKFPIVAIAVIAIIGLIGSELYRASQAKSLAEASAQLDASKTIDDYKKVIAAHQGTLAAANATMLLGRLQADAKDYSGAAQTWKKFAEDFPKNPLVPNALMGQAAALEALAKYDEARPVYQRVEMDYAKSYLGPLASLAEAGMLKSQGKISDARRVFENVIASAPQSDAARQATESLRLLKLIPTLPAATPAPTVAAAALPVTPSVTVAPPAPAAPSVVAPAETIPAPTPLTPASIPAATPTAVVVPPAAEAPAASPSATAIVAPAPESTPVPSAASATPTPSS